MPRVFGLTGDLACGMDTAASIFEGEGVPIVRADRLADELMSPGSRGLRRIVAALGEGVLSSSGALDKAKLGAKIFLDPRQLEVFNEIIVPMIALRSGEAIRDLLSKGHPLVCYAAPKLIEVGAHERFRPLVVVLAPLEVQTRALMEQYGFSEAEACALAQGTPPNNKVALADFVIHNHGRQSDLRTDTLKVLASVRSRY